MEATHTERCDVCVVGAGAAGLAAAIFAAEMAPRRRIVVLEGAAKVGAKILISGGGRCNVTHELVRPEDFNGSRPVVRNVLAAFDAEAAVRWFAGMGVALKREETGKLFPVTDKARTVLEALLQRCKALGVEVRGSHRVLAVEPGPPFSIRHAHGRLTAERVVLAVGGRSLPRTGSDGSGWEIARRLGHSLTETHPALVPLLLHGGFHRELSGVSHEVELSTFAHGRLADRRTGSLLWTHFGISGPVVLDASRHWVIAAARGENPELRCSFLPGRSFEALEKDWLSQQAARPRVSVHRLLADNLPDRLGEALARAARVDAGAPAAQITREQRRALLHHLVEYRLPVARARGWDFAEVTAGGVPLDEIDYRNMRSRRVPGLFLIGEMLDCDGRIGGFNFQWAWATGYLAGSAA